MSDGAGGVDGSAAAALTAEDSEPVDDELVTSCVQAKAEIPKATTNATSIRLFNGF